MPTQEVREFLYSLVREAKRLLIENPSALQVNFLVTASEKKEYYFLYDLEDKAPEDACLDRLRRSGDTQVDFWLCMWGTEEVVSDAFCLDMPAWTMRKKLVELNPENRDICILLWGENGINGFRLSRSL